MKIIHCADIHLDAAESSLPQEKAKERRAEILVTFQNMIQFAADKGVEHVLIAGDLFDTRKISAVTKSVVLTLFRSHPEITFYYLRGNHDTETFFMDVTDIPENVKVFANSWTSYVLNPNSKANLVLTGAELTDENADQLTHSLTLNHENYNIVTLHGSLSSGTKANKDIIPESAYRNLGIDYFALGHIHEHSIRNLNGDIRCKCVYPGCLEGRGFDETGEYGFMFLDFDEDTKRMDAQFIPFAKRRIYQLPLDVTTASDSSEVGTLIQKSLEEQGVSDSALVRMLLVGDIDLDTEIDTDYLEKLFEEKYYIFQVKDQTGRRVDYRAFRHDMSLKGEFVRTVEEDPSLSEEEKAMVIAIGINALSKEGGTK